MDKSALAFLIFCIVSIIVAYIAHKNIRQYILASLVAGISSSVIYQILGVFVLGYLDPFFIIAFVVGTVIAIIIACIVGIPFVRKHAKEIAEE